MSIITKIYRDLWLFWRHSQVYELLENYFVSRWWERHINNKLQKIWEGGKTPEELNLPVEIKPFIFNWENRSIPNLKNAIEVYESEFGIVKINWDK